MNGKTQPPPKTEAKRRVTSGKLVATLCTLTILIVLENLASGPIYVGIKTAHSNQMTQMSRSLALMMFQYSIDHDGHYPDGKSSTEIFQKLIDGKYVTDSSMFFIPMTGKTKPVAGQPLKPENVCFDVTSPVEISSSDGLPLVFSTGYKVNYVPDASAISLIKPYPIYLPDHRTWLQKWFNRPPLEQVTGISVCYKSNMAEFKNLPSSDAKSSDGIIPHFTSADFDPQGKTYRQLTPDGTLP